MKRLIPIRKIMAKMLLSVVLVFSVAACSEDDSVVKPSIVDLAVATPSLSTLLNALSTFPDLVDVLDGNGSFTVFAPTNEAFNDLLTTLGVSSLDEIPEATLRNVLEYHVIASAAVQSSQLVSGGYETVLGSKVYVSVGSGVTINGIINVTLADAEASNGVVHVVDAVILPPTNTIAEIVSNYANNDSNAEFTQLLAALARTSGQSGGNDLLAAVSTATADLTVFAPTDAAFEALYAALQVNSVDEIPLETLIAVLKHHVVGARAFSSDLISGSLTTLNGNVSVSTTNLTITGGSGGNNVATLQASLLNIHATNGVVHVIDKVLLP